MPHWAKMQIVCSTFGPREVFTPAVAEPRCLHPCLPSICPPVRPSRGRSCAWAELSSSCSRSSKVKRRSSSGKGEQIKAHCRKVVPLALRSCNSCRYNNDHLTFWHIRWAKQRASQCRHNIAQGSKSQPWAKQVYDILLLVFRGYGYEERHLREEQMKITKKVKARVDKLIDNILDGTDLHVDYKLLLMSPVDCRPQSKWKWAHSLLQASKFLRKGTAATQKTPDVLRGRGCEAVLVPKQWHYVVQPRPSCLEVNEQEQWNPLVNIFEFGGKSCRSILLFNVLRLIDYLIGGKDFARKDITLVLASSTRLFVKSNWKNNILKKNFKSNLLNFLIVDIMAQKQNIIHHSSKFVASSHIAP